MSEADALGPVFEALVERIVERKLAEKLGRAASAPASSGAMPVPLREAAKVTGIGVSTLRAWIASGRLPKRTLGAGSKRPTYGVLLEEVRAATAAELATPPQAKPIELQTAAAQLRARAEKRG